MDPDEEHHSLKHVDCNYPRLINNGFGVNSNLLNTSHHSVYTRRPLAIVLVTRFARDPRTRMSVSRMRAMPPVHTRSHKRWSLKRLSHERLTDWGSNKGGAVRGGCV